MIKWLRIEESLRIGHTGIGYHRDFQPFLPPQGFRPEAKSRGGTLVARAYIKDSTYSTNMQSVYRKNLDLLEQGPRGIGR